MEKKTTTKTTPRKSAETTSEKIEIIGYILKDHEPLKDLIQTLKDEELTRREKAELFEEFALLLTSHAKAEEQSLYLEMKNLKWLRADSFEGETEHALAEQLLHEINATPDDDEWMAKVKVIAELVEHHIEFEEEEMLKLVEERMTPTLRREIGDVYLQLKHGIISLQHSRSGLDSRNQDHFLN